MSRTYAQFPEVESERTTQEKARQHYGTVVVVEFKKLFYAILCVNFVREVRYFTSKVAIFSLSALVVRKVTGSEIIG